MAIECVNKRISENLVHINIIEVVQGLKIRSKLTQSRDQKVETIFDWIRFIACGLCTFDGEPIYHKCMKFH